MRERRLVLLAVGVLAALRCATFVVFGDSRFDSDQALLGLMARHLIEGRAFPVFTYGQPYMLGVEAWMAAPFFLVGGATVAMLKLPLLLVNVVTAVLLVRVIERAGGIRPVVAAVPALFFILAPPGTSTLLLEASGGNVEPFLIVVLLWLLRDRPLAFGAVLAFGVLQREFAVYGFGAIVALALMDRSLFRRHAWPAIGAGAAAFAGVWQGVYLLKQFSSIAGPGTSATWRPLEASANLAALAGRICIVPSEVLPALRGLVTTHLADLLGASDQEMAAYTINSVLHQGAPWLWPILGPALALGLARVVWLGARRGLRPWQPPVAFASYLLLVGLQAVLVYAVVRCGALGIAEMRYSLLGVYGAVGIVAAFLAIEPRRWLRMAGVGVVLLWAGVAVTAHARLARQYAFDPPVNARRVLADTLLAQGVRYAYADFWEAYIVSFYTDEQVIVASTNFVFIDEYQWLVDRRSDEAVHIRREACAGGTAVADWVWICPPEGGAVGSHTRGGVGGR
ncbi:MAG: hypothetical protein R2752_20475 [Vicinamibacterales bacterium]